MGEATHGTKDFFDIKAKSFEYLVKYENFRIFAIEASYGECNYINDYIQTGIGNIDSVMNYFDFWTWRTEEVRELILWMKNYNQENAEKLRFYGFDMQSIAYPMEYLAHFFKNDSSNYVHSLRGIINPITSKQAIEVWLLSKNNRKFKDTLNIISNDLETWFNNNESALREKYTLKKLKLLKYNLITYNQAINIHGNEYKYRDRCMAKNVLEILNMENKKMFLWAHNGHVNKSMRKYKFKWMGEHLFEKLQFKYYAVGFVFSEGSFQAFFKPKKRVKSELKVSILPVYRKNTFTKPLDELDDEQLFIDLQQTENSLFEKKLKTYQLGALFVNQKWASGPIIAKKQFDGIIYIKNISHAVPIE